MTTNLDILNYLDEKFPLKLQISWDNSGFLVGDRQAEAKRVLLALDVTADIIGEAADKGCSLIVSHHPVIWNAMKSMIPENVQQNNVMELVRRDIAVISMHTNLDIAEGGVNDVLMKLLEAVPEGALDEDSCGRVGYLTYNAPVRMPAFLELCREKLKTNGLRYYDSGRPVSRLAVMGGAGGHAVQAAYDKGCDTYLTADLKYDQFLLARQLGMNLIDGDHFCTENPVMGVLLDLLRERFPDTVFILSEKHGQSAQFC